MSKGSVTGAASFEALEAAFIEELAPVLSGGRAGTWVVAPTNLLALHLRREAGRRLGGVMGVEFLTLADAARRMAQPHLAARGARPMPPGAAELFLRTLLDDAPATSYLAAFRQFNNAAPAVHRAIQLLTNCLWTPQALRRAAREAPFPDPTAPGRLRALADVWSGLLAWKAEKGLFDADDLILQAGRPAPSPAECPARCFLYGFYDFAPAQRALVACLISLAEAFSAYVLWSEEGSGPAPGFEYALPAVRWLQQEMGAEGVRAAPDSGAGSDLRRLRDGLFRQQPLVPEPEARRRLTERQDRRDGSVRVVSCPGEASEAVEVARAVLRTTDGRAPDPAARAPSAVKAGVLLRNAEEGASLVAESLDRADIRHSIREGLPLADTASGRVALKLLDLARGDAARADVVDFLALAEIRWPQDMSATAIDRLSRQAGVTRGKSQWRERLTAYAGELLRQSEEAEDERDRGACARDAELCRIAAGFVDDLFGKLDLLAARSWPEAARKLGSLVQEYAPADDEGAGPVQDAIAGLARLEVTGTQPDAGRLSWALGRLLAQEGLKRERFLHAGVCISGIMGLRGVTFDTVIVPGLVEKGFPRHAPASGLLTELDRDVLNELSTRFGCGMLPGQADRPLEERYLFRMAVASARLALVLAYPRLEQDSGRPKIASRFLTGACSALCGESVSPSMLDEGLPAGLVERVPLSRRKWQADDQRLALDALEYDAAVFGGPSGESLRVGYAAAVSPFFSRAMEMERSRWGRADFGPYDGKLRALDLLEALRASGASPARSVSPTRLEAYARCPFEHFLTYVLGVQRVEEPSEEFELTPLERGYLVHELLRRLCTERLKGREWGEMSDADVAAVLSSGARTLDELGRVHAASLPAVWQAERERMLDELAALLEHERSNHPDAAASLTEYGFGAPAQEGYSLALGPDLSLAFRGRVDRVDALRGGSIGVVDYKTGTSDGYKKTSFRGGRQLQLPIYLLAASHLLKASAGSARYLFVRQPRDMVQFTLAELRQRTDDLRRTLRIIVEAIAAGDFFPLPPDDGNGLEVCERRCPYDVACGAARGYLAEMKRTDPDAARLAELRQIE